MSQVSKIMWDTCQEDPIFVISNKMEMDASLHDNKDLASRVKFVPAKPGVYIMRSCEGAVIYVGKSKNLRRRLASYFTRKPSDAKTMALIAEADDFEIHLAHTERQALLLEEKLIVEMLPKYNIAQRRGRRRYWISIDISAEFPTLDVVTGKTVSRSEGRFGPFPSLGCAAWLVKFLNRLYGIRSCKFRRPDASHHKHCPEPVISNCSAPCVGQIGSDEYRWRVEGVLRWLRQPRWKMMALLDEHMRQLAKAKQFEKAAACRDAAAALQGPGNSLPKRGLKVYKEMAEYQLKCLAEELRLARIPTVIEAFDISHFGGRGNVASVVRFVQGLPDKKRYQCYRLELDGPNDTGCIFHSVKHHYDTNPLPDIIVIDGGGAQFSAAREALKSIGKWPTKVIALAKRRETIFLETNSTIQLPLDSDALHLVQRIRDEAHRTANAYTRNQQLSRIRGGRRMEKRR